MVPLLIGSIMFGAMLMMNHYVGLLSFERMFQRHVDFNNTNFQLSLSTYALEQDHIQILWMDEQFASANSSSLQLHHSDMQTGYCENTVIGYGEVLSRMRNNAPTCKLFSAFVVIHIPSIMCDHFLHFNSHCGNTHKPACDHPFPLFKTLQANLTIVARELFGMSLHWTLSTWTPTTTYLTFRCLDFNPRETHIHMVKNITRNNNVYCLLYVSSPNLLVFYFDANRN